MKKLITLALCVLLAFGSKAQTIEILPQYGAAWGGGAEIDINNNGYLDLIYGGITRDKRYVSDPDGNDVETEKVTRLLMYNATEKKMELKTTNVFAADRVHFIVVDFNGDGIMDLAVTEHDRGPLSGSGIYQGVGDGTFTKMTPTFSNTNYKFRAVAIAAGDFNNDGVTDLVTIGYEKIEGIYMPYSAVLINKGNYHFEVTNGELLQDYELALATVKAFDYNNDGYMDFIVSANCDNPASNGGARVLADVFANLGEEGPGEFYRLSLGDGTIFQKANGGLDIADFNGDGWLDFAIHGEGGQGTGEPTTGDVWACISHVYLNAKNGSFTDKAQPNFLKDLRPLNSSGTSTRTIDWNGDGHYDLFIPGWNPAPESGTQAGYLLLNDGTGTFGAPTRVPGSSETAIFFPDWDGDGVRDYFMFGQSWDNTYFKTEEEIGRTAALMINARTTVNARPTAPTNLAAAVVGNKLTLSWNAATDQETPAAALSYEFYIKDSTGKFYTSCRSHVGGALDGVRKVLDHGNAMLNKTIKLANLPGGTYQWGVQAIDASYDGSVFATGGSFTIIGSDIDENTMNDKVQMTFRPGAISINTELPASIELFSASGVLIGSNKNVTSFNKELNNGVYIVRVTIDNQPLVRKVIIN